MCRATTLLIRADANARIGTGHIMRCLALAQAWQDNGGQAVLAAHALPPSLQSRLREECIELEPILAAPGSPEDARATVRIAGAHGAAWVVLDGYHFTSEYQRLIKDSGLRLLVLDDNGDCDHYVADLVLNQNIHADASLYPSCEPYTDLLLGTRYALLRREFRRVSPSASNTPTVASKVLVTLGGGDPENVTGRVLDALDGVEIPNLDATVVIGGACRHEAELRSRAPSAAGRISLVCNVTDMPQRMLWAELAVGAAGSTCWERAYLGLPSLMLILADNQVAAASALARCGAAVSLGWGTDVRPVEIARELRALAFTPDRRAELAARSQRLVDGAGGNRVLEAMCSATPCPEENS